MGELSNPRLLAWLESRVSGQSEDAQLAIAPSKGMIIMSQED